VAAVRKELVESLAAKAKESVSLRSKRRLRAFEMVEQLAEQSVIGVCDPDTAQGVTHQMFPGGPLRTFPRELRRVRGRTGRQLHSPFRYRNEQREEPEIGDVRGCCRYGSMRDFTKSSDNRSCRCVASSSAFVFQLPVWRSVLNTVLERALLPDALVPSDVAAINRATHIESRTA